MGFYSMLRKLPDISGGAGASKELKKSLEITGSKYKAYEIVSLSRWVIIFLGLFFSGVFLVFPNSLSFLAIFAVPLAVAQIFTDIPKNRARHKINMSLDKSPEIISIMASSLRQNPNLERAFENAAKHGQGMIAQDIKKALWQCTIKGKNIKQEMEKIMDKWEQYSEPLSRSFYLLLISVEEKSKKKRDKLLEMAVSEMLDNVSQDYISYVKGLKTPTLLIFSAGIVLPLVLVSLMPLVSMFSSNSLGIVVLALAGVIVFVFAYSHELSLKRPPMLKHKAPQKGKSLLRPLFLFFVFSVPGILSFSRFLGIYFPVPLLWGSISFLMGVGIAIFSYFYLNYKGVEKELEKRKMIEKNTVNFMQKVSLMMSEGISLEQAFKKTGKKISGPLKKTIEKISELMEKRGHDLEKIFSSKNIVVGSKRSDFVFQALADTYSKGSKISSDFVLFLTNQLQMTRRTEKRIQNSLKSYSETMKYSVLLVLPLVGGLSVGMQSVIHEQISGIQNQMFFDMQGLATEFVFLGVGLYILVTLVSIMYFVQKVGSDQSWTKTGKYSLLALGIYIAVFFLTNIL